MQGFLEFCEEKKEDLPFTPDEPKKPIAKSGKYGSGYSTARKLARMSLEKQRKKAMKEDEQSGKITVGEETKPYWKNKGWQKKMSAAAKRERQEREKKEVKEELEEGAPKVQYGTGWMLRADPELKKKVDANTAAHKLAKKYAGKDLPKKVNESSDSHKVMVTVSDPNHQAVTQRKEQIMKHVIVRAGDKGDAQAKAESFYKKKGYKVHGSEYHSKQPATSMKTEEVVDTDIAE